MSKGRINTRGVGGPSGPLLNGASLAACSFASTAAFGSSRCAVYTVLLWQPQHPLVRTLTFSKGGLPSLIIAPPPTPPFFQYLQIWWSEAEKWDEGFSGGASRVPAKSCDSFPLLISSVIMVCSEGLGRVWRPRKKEAGDKMRGIVVNKKKTPEGLFFFFTPSVNETNQSRFLRCVAQTPVKRSDQNEVGSKCHLFKACRCYDLC